MSTELEEPAASMPGVGGDDGGGTSIPTASDRGDCNGQRSRSIGDIGLYSDVGSVPASLVGALDDDEGGGAVPSPSASSEGDDGGDGGELPVVLRRLARRGYRPNGPCPISVLNEVDNMNYHGADASLELLDEIRRRLGHVDAGTADGSDDGEGHPEAPTAEALRLADVGSGFGGTARVMCNAPLPPFPRTTTTCVAVELQRHIHESARVLTRMAELSGDLAPGQVSHVCGDAVTGEFDPPSLVPADGSLDAVVSRLAILHVPMDAKVKLLKRCSSWLRPGGVLAVEDYAASDAMPELTDEARRLLKEDVYVPDGVLPTLSGWRSMLNDCGFVDVVVEDVTGRWARFVRDRVVEAEGDDGGRKFDDEMGGDGSEAGARRREFFASVDRLFNPPEANGLVGVRIYATRA